MAFTPLLPLPADWCITSLVVQDTSVHVGIAVTAKTAPCPLCHMPAERIHSRYTRMTNRLIRALQATGIVAGAETSARLAQQLGMRTSPATVLNQVMRVSVPVPASVRVVGVDEWAWKKGRRYGTILVDLERHCVIDILPDDVVATVRDWLAKHPDIDLIARDRANAFADAARQGAPTALQTGPIPLITEPPSRRAATLGTHRSCLPTERQIADQPTEASGDLSTRFWYCLGVVPDICPPHRPDLNGVVKRFHHTLDEECLQVEHPTSTSNHTRGGR